MEESSLAAALGGTATCNEQVSRHFQFQRVQLPCDFEGDERSEAVPEKSERLIGMPSEYIHKGTDEFVKSVERSFAEPRPPARKLYGAYFVPRGQKILPWQVAVRISTRAREAVDPHPAPKTGFSHDRARALSSVPCAPCRGRSRLA